MDAYSTLSCHQETLFGALTFKMTESHSVYWCRTLDLHLRKELESCEETGGATWQNYRS